MYSHILGTWKKKMRTQRGNKHKAFLSALFRILNFSYKYPPMLQITFGVLCKIGGGKSASFHADTGSVLKGDSQLASLKCQGQEQHLHARADYAVGKLHSLARVQLCCY